MDEQLVEEEEEDSDDEVSADCDLGAGGHTGLSAPSAMAGVTEINTTIKAHRAWFGALKTDFIFTCLLCNIR